ncbi:MAG: hypothetical protein M3Y56_16670 [Armatimonadota bacterium]|nr:hypothetical protein [Armatimonadota bacterium]
MEETRVIIGADNQRVRSHLAKILSASGLDAETLASSSSLDSMSLTPRDVILLETNDDVAALMQKVYNIYSACSTGEAPQIIGFVSSKVLDKNPALGWWEIDGHAALAALLLTGRSDIEASLAYFIRRLKAAV